MPGAGTDRTKIWAEAPGPVVILVEPQLGENIGAAARAMANFGLSQLRLVAPRQSWPNPKARIMAVGADAILDGATLHQTLEDAIGDCAFVLAATARQLDWLENLDTARDIETQVNVNLLGVIQVTRAVLPYMLKQGYGHIINMSSVAGWIAAPLYTIYSATKFGVRAFTDALRREVSPFGIEVSGIYPGPAETEFGQHTGNSKAKRSLNVFKGLSMTSEYVARRVVRTGKASASAWLSFRGGIAWSLEWIHCFLIWWIGF